MAQVKTADIAKLRKLTGAGMMDCKKALQESNNDIDKAIEIIRERGKAIANKRADREASEGAALAAASADNKKGAIVVLNCETDFVAKNEDFVALTNNILRTALEQSPADLDALKKLEIDGTAIETLVQDQSGITGEKFELSYYEKLEGEKIVTYIHPGNKLATIVAFNKSDVDEQAGKDIAMQIAAMNPISIDIDNVPEKVRKQEYEIGREQARIEGKPEKILDKIAEGRLQKFFKENTLMNQDFIKDAKMSIKDYLKSIDPELKVTGFKRVSLSA
ncbi:MAG: translation elongation factor Ts [Bacteroidales bacterium]|nr:translation elongation factor Ts [Bacteroidales bacterium]MDD4672265.1 translation elongation factor Ts [Bacteroidales bacterium]MDY0348728.1 translation elongation factor Ts [Tenuifilaceae bacterium]